MPPYSRLLDSGSLSQSQAEVQSQDSRLGKGREPWKRPDEELKPVCGVGTRRAREAMRPQDVFAVLVAAMGHDVGHPGLSNAFMVSTFPLDPIQAAIMPSPM